MSWASFSSLVKPKKTKHRKGGLYNVLSSPWQLGNSMLPWNASPTFLARPRIRVCKEMNPGTDCLLQTSLLSTHSSNITVSDNPHSYTIPLQLHSVPPSGSHNSFYFVYIPQKSTESFIVNCNSHFSGEQTEVLGANISHVRTTKLVSGRARLKPWFV